MTPTAAVFDCMVYLQAAARAAGPARVCLDLAKDGQISLFVSPATRAELADVLNRPKVRQKFRSLTADAVAVFLADMDRLTTTIDNIPEAAALPRDPKDAPYLNLALAARAAYLVTWDQDLLDLMNEDLPAGKDFRRQYPTLTILSPVAFLDELRSRAQAPEQERRRAAEGEGTERRRTETNRDHSG
jgi:putative PIN family toxin of toxin-antitoxin system